MDTDTMFTLSFDRSLLDLPSHLAIAVAFSIVAGFLVLIARVLSIGRRPRNYPPGPPTLPVIGNIHQFPKTGLHFQFQRWAKEC